TVKRQRALTEHVHIGNCPQTTSNESLNFVRSARWSAPANLSRSSLLSSSRQHGVLSGDPTFPTVPQKRRHSILERGSADDFGVAHFDQHRPFRIRKIARRYAHFAQLIQ